MATRKLTPLEALKEIGKIKENGCAIKTTIEYKIVKDELCYSEMRKLIDKSMIYINTDAIIAKLRALEIIKKKKVNVFALLLSDSLKTFNNKYDFDLISYRKLTKEEFNLLKEVLL